MTIGEVVDYIIEYNDRNKEDTKKEEKTKRRRANQSDIDAFLGR